MDGTVNCVGCVGDRAVAFPVVLPGTQNVNLQTLVRPVPGVPDRVFAVSVCGGVGYAATAGGFVRFGAAAHWPLQSAPWHGTPISLLASVRGHGVVFVVWAPARTTFYIYRGNHGGGALTTLEVDVEDVAGISQECWGVTPQYYFFRTIMLCAERGQQCTVPGGAVFAASVGSRVLLRLPGERAPCSQWTSYRIVDTGDVHRSIAEYRVFGNNPRVCAVDDTSFLVLTEAAYQSKRGTLAYELTF
tara:strand:+ start:81 stop:815 length:735 start_codon:yes stop_codon:yes gene_type:complete